MDPTRDWIDVAGSGRTLEAIVAYRAQMGVGLAEAKEAVERWVDVNLPPPLEYRVALRAARRLHLKLQEVIEGGRQLSYLMRVVSDRPDRHSGHPSLLAAHLPEGYAGRDLEVLFPLSDVPKRVWCEEVEDYLATGVRLVVVAEVDIEEPAVTVYVNGGETRVYLRGATIDGGDVLPGFSCQVADLFS